MDRLTVLGTGNAAVTRCYNTCFLLELPQGYLLCDAGGGNGILSQLEKAGVDLAQIHHLILTHAHSDHLLGAVWVVRMVAAAMNAGRYEGELTIWCDPSVREGLCQMARITLQKKMTDRLGDRILFHDISDGQTGHWAHAGRRRSRRAPPAYRGSAAAQGGGPPYATAPDEEFPAPAPARRHP